MRNRDFGRTAVPFHRVFSPLAVTYFAQIVGRPLRKNYSRVSDKLDHPDHLWQSDDELIPIE